MREGGDGSSDSARAGSGSSGGSRKGGDGGTTGNDFRGRFLRAANSTTKRLARGEDQRNMAIPSVRKSSIFPGG